MLLIMRKKGKRKAWTNLRKKKQTVNPYEMEMLDLLNEELILPDNSEGAAFGAAVLGFIASGELSGIGATGDLVKPRRIIRPNPEDVRVYGELYKIFDSLYWKLQPELASIAAFQQNRA